ncbi:hypothetical protein, partial [Phytobacter massiliensis]|uniref:hypothetical protein n=1 Tax=Phytobacter massiliensis TaxID=1485952 RepID=UPI001F2CAF94
VHQRQRAVGARLTDKGLPFCTVFAALSHQAGALPDEEGGFPVTGFAQATVKGIVGVCGDRTVGRGVPDQAVAAVVNGLSLIIMSNHCVFLMRNRMLLDYIFIFCLYYA